MTHCFGKLTHADMDWTLFAKHGFVKYGFVRKLIRKSKQNQTIYLLHSYVTVYQFISLMPFYPIYKVI